MTGLTAYSGTVTPTVLDGADGWTASPNGNGNLRIVTPQILTPPLVVAGWIKPTVDRTYHPTDGVHVHVGHAGNDRNYVASLVRRDGRMAVKAEYGWRGYRSLAYHNDGPALLVGRTYLFRVEWHPDRITTWLGNEAGAWTMEAKIPDDRIIPAGTVGFRLDRLECQIGFTVR